MRRARDVSLSLECLPLDYCVWLEPGPWVPLFANGISKGGLIATLKPIHLYAPAKGGLIASRRSGHTI
jgi:hypothetical protein